MVPGQLELEVSHHYGIDNFNEYGLEVVTVVNREYCKRIHRYLRARRIPSNITK